MLNIVIPMAGAGSRFSNVGYKLPKPLIEVFGQPMIRRVIDNLRPCAEHRFIFICQASHLERYGLADKLSAWAPGCATLTVPAVTEGAACTVLTAGNLIDNDDPLMIANSDQFVTTNINTYLDKLDASDLDGLIMTMCANDPKWSFVATDNRGLVTKVVEKQPISAEATVGIYNFRHGRDFVVAAMQMIADDDRVNNEFYVAPVYNRLIAQRKRIGIANIGSVGNGMYGLGTPEDLDHFHTLPVSKTIAHNLS